MGNKVKKDPRKVSGSGGGKGASFSLGEVYSKNQFVFQTIAVLAALIFSFIVYHQSSASILNLTDASEDTLKGVFTGDKPFVLYCARGQGKDEKVHPIFADLNKVQGGKYGFAMVNCNHKLPSGKTIMERFGLNRKVKPIIFMTAPWFGGRAKQAPGGSLKDVKTLRKHVDIALAPRAQEITSDKELAKYCGFGPSSFTNDDKSIGTSCIAFVKGKRHAKMHLDLEEKVIRAYPRQRYVSIDANKRRLSFEDAESMPSDSFALKVHALRNGTHHMSMVNPVTWDYTSTFVGHAVGTPLYDFEGDNASPVGIKKVTPTTAFRDRSAPRAPGGGGAGGGSSQTGGGSQDPTSDEYEGNNMTKEQKKARRERLKAERGAQQEAERELTPEELEAHRLEREKKAREYVEKMQRENEIEEADPNDEEYGEEGGDGDEEDEEDLIEL